MLFDTQLNRVLCVDDESNNDFFILKNARVDFIGKCKFSVIIKFI